MLASTRDSKSRATMESELEDDHKKQTTARRYDKWLVLFGSFICQLFSAGFGNSLGIFYVEFFETFQAGRGVVGWATSICSGLVFGAGLVVGLVVEKLGPRKSAILGGILSFAGLLISSFAYHISVIYVAFGVLTGTGCCLVCVSSFVSVGHHFDKSRGSASSLAVVGSGMGGLLFPIVLRPVIDEFGWRGAMLILSALMLNVLPAAGLFVPPKQKKHLGETTKPVRLKTALCNRSLWKNPSFVCYLIICPIISIGYQYTFIVIVDLGILLGFNKVTSSLLLTYMNLASTFSTLCFGYILKLLWNHSVLLFNICLITMSIVMFVYPYVTSYETLVLASTAYGAAIGGINGLYAVLTADLLGLKRYSTGLGLICTGFGIGYLLSAPVAGLLIDFTGSYNVSFYVASSLCVSSVIPFAIIRGVQVRQQRNMPDAINMDDIEIVK